MNRTTAWMLAIWLPLAAAAAAPPQAGAEVPAERILGELPDEIGIEERRAAEVVVSGDLAAVRLASGIYLLERDAGARWRPVTRITALGEAHFGDSMLLASDTLLVAAPDTAGAGLGPGMAYVFQRHVGGSDRWGLVARLTPAAYPPPGAVEVRQLAPAAEAPPAVEAPAAETPVAETPPVETPPVETPSAETETAVSEDEPLIEEAVVEPPVEEAVVEPAVEEAVAEVPPPTVAESDDEEPAVEEAVVEAPPAAETEPAVTEDEPPIAEAATEDEPTVAETPSAETPSAEAEPVVTADRRFIVIANMREKPRALALAAGLRDQGYPSEVYRNDRGFFIVTLAHLPRVEARRVRAEAVAAGDIPADSYLIIGSAFRARISP